MSDSTHITSPSPMCRDWIADWEGGYILKAYKPTPQDVWTIGAGMTWYPQGWSTQRRVVEGDQISLAQAQTLFDMVLAQMARELDSLTRDDLSQGEFDALMDLYYNIGREQFRTSTLRRMVNENSFRDITPNPEGHSNLSDEWGKWVHQGKNVLTDLVRRRQAEVDCYLHHGGMMVTRAGVDLAQQGRGSLPTPT